jgi:ATP-dependent Clp protease ATP-binding subunit ClpA
MSWLETFWKKPKTPPVPPIRPSPPEPATQFTPRAQQVLALSRQEAERFKHNFVGTEHLLLGLIRLGQGTAVTVLAKLGLDLESARREVEKQIGHGPDQKIIGHIPYTPRVKKVLALAAREAKALHHTYVGTEHILLGLLTEGDGVAARVLQNLGVDTEKTRQEILNELDPNLSRTNMNTNPAEMPASVDTNKRYDIYCAEPMGRVVVYRNALFKARPTLLSTHQHDFRADFLELEQSNGQTVCVARHSVIKFSAPGAEIIGEIIPPK